jgi:hypothetical protein
MSRCISETFRLMTHAPTERTTALASARLLHRIRYPCGMRYVYQKTWQEIELHFSPHLRFISSWCTLHWITWMSCTLINGRSEIQSGLASCVPWKRLWFTVSTLDPISLRGTLSFFFLSLSLSHTHTRALFSSLCHPDQCQNASHGGGSSSRIGSQVVLCKSALRLQVCTMMYHSLICMSHLFVRPAEQTARTLYSVHVEPIYQAARAHFQRAVWWICLGRSRSLQRD